MSSDRRGYSFGGYVFLAQENHPRECFLHGMAADATSQHSSLAIELFTRVPSVTVQRREPTHAPPWHCSVRSFVQYGKLNGK